MSDQRLRILERSTDPEARARLLHERVRLGLISPRRVALAARLGHPDALACQLPAKDVEEDPWDWPKGTLDNRTLLLVTADFAERALLLERARGREPDDRSWAAVEAARSFARGEIGAATMKALRDAAQSAAYAAYAAHGAVQSGAQSAAYAAHAAYAA